MPRGRKPASSSAKGKKTFTETVEPSPSTRKTRGSSAVASPTASKKARKASPSPAPVQRGQSRGRAAAAKKGSTPSKSKNEKGQGDVESEVKGKTPRATRAAVETTAEAPSRGRSASKKKQEVAPVPAKSPGRGRSASKPKAATPSKAAKLTPSKEKATPKQKATPKKATPTPKKATPAKKTPAKKTPAKKTPAKSPKNKTPKSRTTTPSPAASKSRSRSKSQTKSPKGSTTSLPESDLPAAQLVLTKIDDKTKTPPSRSGSRSRSASRTPTSAEGKESPSEDAEKTETPKEEISAEEAADATKEPEVSDAMEEEETEGTADVPEEAVESEGEKDTEEKVAEEKSEDMPQEEETVPEPAHEEEEETLPEEADTIPESEPDEADTIPEPDESESEPVLQEAEKIADLAEEAVQSEPSTVNSTGEEEMQTNGTDYQSEEVNRKRKIEEVDDAEDTMSLKKSRQMVDDQQNEIIIENGTSEPAAADVAMETTENDSSASAEPVQSHSSESLKPTAEESSVDEEYVMVQMDEVPPADSEEVLKSVPNELQKDPDNVSPKEIQEDAPIESMIPVDDMPNEIQQDIQLPVESVIPVVDTPPPSQPTPPSSQPTAMTPEAEVQIAPETNNTTEPILSVPEVPLIQEVPQADLNVQVPQVTSDNTNEIHKRTFIPNPSYQKITEPGKQFSVVSYNILAQCHLERNDYSFTEPQYLSASYRHEKLVKELQYLDGDIVCMQEVGPTYFNNELLPAMQKLGYHGLMKKRVDDLYDEGEATIYKTSRFNLVESKTYSMKELVEVELEEAGVAEDVKGSIRTYLDLPDVLVLTKLACNVTGTVLTVANVHINWGQMKIPDAQCIQIVCAIREIVRQAGSDSNPRILCGDFNSEVTSAGYQLATEGYFNDDVLKQLQALDNLDMPDGTRAPLINHIWRSFQHTSDLKSSYLVANGSEPSLTSYNGVMKAAVDYIFYGGNGLDVTGVLKTVSDDSITRTGGIPDETYPSDHVSLKTSFSLS